MWAGLSGDCLGGVSCLAVGSGGVCVGSVCVGLVGVCLCGLSCLLGGCRCDLGCRMSVRAMFLVSLLLTLWPAVFD